MKQTIREEVQRMTLLSKYDNSKTLTEQNNTNLTEDTASGFEKLFQNFPCVLKLKGITYVDDRDKESVEFGKSRYVIWNNDHYYPNGTKSGNNGLVRFTCDDPEFKAGTSTAQKAGTSTAQKAGTSTAQKAGTSTAQKAGTSTAQKAGTSTAQKAGTSTTQKTIPTELKDENGVMAFQDWLDINAAGWATGYKEGIIKKGENGGGYGRFGPRTQKAWEIHKEKYLKPPVSENPYADYVPEKTNDAVEGDDTEVPEQ